MGNWNFRGYIALPLEEYGREYSNNSRITADEIECGQFVHAMLSLLKIKSVDLKGVPGFVLLCEEYADKPASEIPEDKAKEMFEEFERLIHLKRRA